MARYFFHPSEVEVPRLAALRGEWAAIEPGELKECIVQEEQTLNFQRAILQQLRFHIAGEDWMKTGYIDHSLRAGFVRSAVKLYASIAEAALLHHALKRGYFGEGSQRGRYTLGKIKAKWESPQDSGNPREEVADIWPDLSTLQDMRNHVHLTEMAEQGGRDFRTTNASEPELLAAGERVLKRLKSLRSPS